MSLDNVQVNTGMALAEIGVPFTDVHFENNPLVYAAAGAALVGVGAVTGIYNRYKNAANDVVFADQDQEYTYKNNIRKQKIGAVVTSALAFSALSSGLANLADPFTKLSHPLVESVAVIVDASYSSYANDIVTKDGTVLRLEASVNGINELKTPGITYTLIAAGTEAKQMGNVTNGNGKTDVVANFDAYIKDLNNKPVADLAGALNIADALDTDKTIIITDSLESVSANLLDGEDQPGINNISTIALGNPGSTVKYLGQQVSVTQNVQSNVFAVGIEDSYATSSVEGFQKIVKEISDTQYTKTEKSEFKGFEKLRDFAALGLIGKVTIGALIGSFKRRLRSMPKKENV
ncbi:MAG: hypothetical protein WCJ60_02035 [bacterium]